MELIVIGHIMAENIYYKDGKIIGPVLGGPASYSSVCAGVLGVKTGLVTIIGKDMPYYLIDPIVKAGVDIKGLNIIGENSRTTDLKYGVDGKKKVYYRKVAPVITSNCIPDKYFASKAFFVCPQDFEIEIDLIDNLKKLNKILMTDLGGFGGVVSTKHPINGDKEIKNKVKKIVSYFNIVKASSEDCSFLFENADDHQNIIKELHKWGSDIVILTLGAKGSIISDKNNLFEIKSLDVDTLDTTGAGDVYCAAFLSKFLKTKDLYKSGLYANKVSSYLITKKGGVSIERMPTKAQLEKFKVKN